MEHICKVCNFNSISHQSQLIRNSSLFKIINDYRFSYIIAYIRAGKVFSHLWLMVERCVRSCDKKMLWFWSVFQAKLIITD